MHIGENISDMAHALRDRLQSMRHLNEKHVDDMPDVESEYSVDDPKAELAKQQQQLENQTGVNPVVKTFYEGKNSNATYYEWVDSPPRQLSKRVAKQHDRVAIKLYKAKDLDKPVLSGRFALKPHMMEIQNPILVAALKDIVAKEDVHLELSETVTFKEPFRALYFCHDEITALHRTTPEGSALKLQLQLLLKVMADIFANVRKPVRQLQASGLINFRLAWTYFPKDCIVYSPGKDAERIYKIVDTSYQLAPKPPRLLVKAKEIAFDGSAYVWQDVAFGIAPWEGNKPVTKLQYYPLEFHPDPESVKKRIGERGERVLDYQGLKYCMYTGLGIYEDDRVLEKHNVSFRFSTVERSHADLGCRWMVVS